MQISSGVSSVTGERTSSFMFKKKVCSALVLLERRSQAEWQGTEKAAFCLGSTA